MHTLVLSMEDIQVIVKKAGLDALMDEMIRRLTEAFMQFDPQATVIPVRSGFAYTDPAPGLVEWMPAMEAGRQVMIKVVSYHPCNPVNQGLPTIVSTISAYDTRNGHLLGIADGAFLTALRTGAASAIAAQHLASEQSRVVGIIGCGAQAVSQLHALARLFEIEQVLAYDIDPAVSRSYPERTAFMGLKVTAVDASQLDQLVGSADILTTCTSVEIGGGPVFRDRGLKPWVHINAVGSDFPGKIELPLSVLKASLVCPDFLDQAIKEGECQRLAREEIGPSISEVVQNPAQYAAARQSKTVFDSTGWALEDQVAMQMLLEYARELGVGRRMHLENINGDLHNPYSFGRPNPRGPAAGSGANGFQAG